MPQCTRKFVTSSIARTRGIIIYTMYKTSRNRLHLPHSLFLDFDFLAWALSFAVVFDFDFALVLALGVFFFGAGARAAGFFF